MSFAGFVGLALVLLQEAGPSSSPGLTVRDPFDAQGSRDVDGEGVGPVPPVELAVVETIVGPATRPDVDVGLDVDVDSGCEVGATPTTRVAVAADVSGGIVVLLRATTVEEMAWSVVAPGSTVETTPPVGRSWTTVAVDAGPPEACAVTPPGNSTDDGVVLAGRAGPGPSRVRTRGWA